MVINKECRKISSRQKGNERKRKEEYSENLRRKRRRKERAIVGKISRLGWRLLSDFSVNEGENAYISMSA